MSYLKIKDNDKLIRDESSNAILNVDINSYNSYLIQYKKKYNEIKKMKDYESQLNELKGEISDIKSMLSQIVNKMA